MGWNNPPVPWSELERALSGRAPKSGQKMLRSVRYDDPGPSPPRVQRPPEDRHRVPYAELHSHSAFSFLDGASTPEMLVAEALRLGLDALAVTDHDGLYGIVRFAEAAADTSLKTLYGAELSIGLPEPQLGVPDPVGEHLLVLARGQAGYTLLSQQITTAQLRGGEKGRPIYDLDELAAVADDQWLILTGCRKGSVRRALARAGPDAARAEIIALMDRFGRRNVAVELTTQLAPTDDEDNDVLAELAAGLGLALVATTGAHYATPRDARLGAAMAAVRARRSLDEADPYLPAGPGAHLRSGAEMAALFARYPTAVPTAAAIGEECSFDLHLVAPNLPPYDVPAGHDENSWLRELTMAGAARRYGPPEAKPGCLRADRQGAADHRAARLPRLFPDRVRHRPVLPRSPDHVPGPGIRRQLGGLLRAGHHRGGRGQLPAAVRAVPGAGAGRPAGHRHRHRVRPAGGGHPARLRAPTAARTPRRSPTSTRSGRGWPSGTWPRRSVTRRASRTRTPSSSTAGRRWRQTRASSDVHRPATCSRSPARSRTTRGISASTPAAW